MALQPREDLEKATSVHLLTLKRGTSQGPVGGPEERREDPQALWAKQYPIRAHLLHRRPMGP